MSEPKPERITEAEARSLVELVGPATPPSAADTLRRLVNDWRRLRGLIADSIGPGVEVRLSVEQDRIGYRVLSEPDPNWHFTDAAGHEHRWVGDYKHSELPTCEWVWDEEENEDSEYPRRGHWQCRGCGASIDPQTRPSPVERSMPGLRHERVTLEGGEPLAALVAEAEAIWAESANPLLTQTDPQA